MKFQILQDNLGNQTGVYVPIEEWNFIKLNYPDLESLDEELPDWEKSLIDSRLATIASQPERLKPISVLLELLKPKI